MSMSLPRYIEYTNTFRFSLQRQFVDQFCHKDFALKEKDIEQNDDENYTEQEMHSHIRTHQKSQANIKKSFLKNPPKPIDFKDSMRKRKTKKDQTNVPSSKGKKISSNANEN